MPKVKISEYSATANSNTDVASINIDEGCAPSGINNAIRAVMGHLKDFQQGTYGDPFNGPVNGTVGATTPSTGAFTTLSSTGNSYFATSSGSVGIGTSSPLGKLQVKGANPQIFMEDSAGGTNGKFTAIGTSNGNMTFNRYLDNGTLFGQFMTLDASGNWGIGTTSPSFRLHAVSSAAVVSRIGSSGGSGAFINFIDSGASPSVAPSVGAIGNSLVFMGDGSSSERARIDSSGNLGLGVTPVSSVYAPARNLFVGQGTVLTGRTTINFTSLNNNCYELPTSSVAAFINSSFAASQYIQYQGAHLWTRSTATPSANADIVSVTSMTLDASGNLLVGTTSELGARFNSSSGTRAWAGWFQQVNNAGNSVVMVEYSTGAPNNTGDYFGLFRDTGGQRIQLRSNGGIGNFSANDVNLSDRREKINFAPAKSYLETICAIPVQTFNYIDQNLEDDGGLTLGVVAQDVQAVAPELVMESNWGTEDEPKMRLSIYQTDLQYALMKALQELKADFDAYKASHP